MSARDCACVSICTRQYIYMHLCFVWYMVYESGHGCILYHICYVYVYIDVVRARSLSFMCGPRSIFMHQELQLCSFLCERWLNEGDNPRLVGEGVDNVLHVHR